LGSTIGSGAGEVASGGLNSNIAIDKMENVYVSDTRNPKVQIFNSEGKFINSFRIPFGIDSIAVNSLGEVYVAVNSTKNIPLVYVFSKDGKLIRSIGERIVTSIGRLSQEVNRTAITIDNQDNLLVVFRHWPLIRKYSQSGKLLEETNFKVPSDLISEAQIKTYSLNFINQHPNTSYTLPLLSHSITTTTEKGMVLLNGHGFVKFDSKSKVVSQAFFRKGNIPDDALIIKLVLGSNSSESYLLDIKSGNIYKANGL